MKQYVNSFLKGIIVGTLLAGFMANAQTTIYYDRPENVFDKITRYANHYGVPALDMIELIRCETANTFKPDIQSKYIQPYGRERSFGWVQIHLPAHPEVTYEQATDPDFALIWAATHWKQRHKEWVTCSKGT